MSVGNGSDPFDRLRAADPIRADDVPEASLARVSARTQEHIMTEVLHRTGASDRPRRLALFGGLALVGALALAMALGSGVGRQQPGGVAEVPTASADVAAGGGAGSCIAYDPATLPTFDMVFDGTVTAVVGDRITFDVNVGWKGAHDSVTLTAPSVSVAIGGPAPDFKVGGRYLVTAVGSNINACGYSLDYDAATAATWAAAFGK